jgi:hypothetical protein
LCADNSSSFQGMFQPDQRQCFFFVSLHCFTSHWTPLGIIDTEPNRLSHHYTTFIVGYTIADYTI